MKRRVVIMGAAGRDFHNFISFFRENPNYEVVAFTAAQLPNISGRVFPKELAGPLYNKDIPILPEEDLPKIIREMDVDVVVFSYSDVSHEYVMNRASIALSCGADFWLLGPKSTMYKSEKPVIAVCATRTGAGKSPTSRFVANLLRDLGLKVVIVRHPMPYGNLKEQEVLKFEKVEDLEKHKCTIEEKEDIEPHLRNGHIVFEGVDYGKILKEAEKLGDVILWDGGNNDFPFYKPDLHIVVADPLRVGHEKRYHPGEMNVRMADVIVINKENTASLKQIEELRKNLRELNPKAIIVDAVTNIFVERPEMIKGKRVLVIEDGPTVTHGEMGFGAAYIAALKYGAKEIVDPRPYAVGSIKDVYQEYRHLDKVLPAIGYGREQMEELEATINSTPCDVVVCGTPTNLGRYLKIDKPMVHVRYEIQFIGKPSLREIIEDFVRKIKEKKA